MSEQLDSTVIEQGTMHGSMALASYATLTNAMTEKQVVAALINADMPEDQAKAFASQYTVVDQFNSSLGGSMTVFQDANGTKYLSVRGTNDWRDWLNDAAYAITGFNAQLGSLKDKVNDWLADGTLPSQFTVDGHSAGGFTALALLQSFPGNITKAYVYNSPGTGGIWGNIADALGICVSEAKVISFGTTGGII